MSFTTLYRISFYLMLTVATLTMSVDVTDNNFSLLFPLAVAALGFLAVNSVDRNPALGLPRPIANFLAIASVSLVLLEYLIEPLALLRALAHWIVYLQLIKMFLPKTPEDDWFLILLGLMQVLVGVFISQSDRVGILMFTWAFLTLWVLSLFSLHRDSLRSQLANFSTRLETGRPSSRKEAEEAIVSEASSIRSSDKAYAGLLEPSFVLSSFRVTALTLALGGAIFLAMPRRGNAVRFTRGSESLGSHLTGFDDEVQLGKLGEILENDSVLMSVELFNEQGERIRPAHEVLWRGVTLSKYEGGRWSREGKGYSTLPTLRLDKAETIKQRIKLEASDSPVLFTLRPVIKVEGPTSAGPEYNSSDGTFMRDSIRPASLDYTVISYANPNLPQPGEERPRRGRREALTRVPRDLLEPLQEIALPIVKDIPENDLEARARALDLYLRGSNQFGYTLKMDVVDRKLDPVLDFLINRKEGHCEYFASALALLCRSIGIPARIVHGFKGGDWNDLAKVLNVRQKFAHSWVEVYLGSDQDSRPRWFTLDPTPEGQRLQSVEQIGNMGSSLRQLTDFVRYIWVFFVVGYNPERQQALVYEPIKRLIRDAQQGFALMGQSIRPLLTNLLHFKDVNQFISIRGFFVSFIGMLLLVALARLIYWVVKHLVRWLKGSRDQNAAFHPGVIFYHRLVQLLNDFGLQRTPTETQHEFARRATVFLAGRGLKAEQVADVPNLVVDAFYRVRFGHLTISPTDLSGLEARLSELESNLRARND